VTDDPNDKAVGGGGGHMGEPDRLLAIVWAPGYAIEQL